MQFTVLNTTGKSTSLEASDAVFAAKINKPLVAQAVRVFLSNQRQGTSKTKTRAEIARTKKKWFKQKGTGNARHGARTPSLFVGGGVAHGPTGTQNWSLNLSRQMKKSAMISALSGQKEHIVVTTVLGDIQPKTKDAVAFLKKLAPESGRSLIVMHEPMENIQRSMSNIPQVMMTTVSRVNIVDVAFADTIIMTKEAVKMLEERLTGKPKQQEVKETKMATPKVEKVEKKVVAKTVKPVVKKSPVKKTVTKKKTTK